MRVAACRMFRDMRRKRQLLSEAETIAMLEACTAYEDGKLYFHAARTGHKMDAIRRNNKASFCVIAADDVVRRAFTTHFRSVIAFGSLRIHTEDGEKRHALECLARKYSPDFVHAADAEVDGEWTKVCAIELAIEHLTGKAAIEVVRERGPKSRAGG